jgi:hypothetical protein
MRALILAVLLFAAVPVVAQAEPPNYFAELEAALPLWATDSSPNVPNAVALVVEQMPYLDSLRTHVLEVSAKHQYHVDVICQHHDSKWLTDTERQGVVDCQRQVVDLLESLNAPIVVGEGFPSDRVKQLDILFTVTQLAQQMGIKGDPVTLEAALVTYLDLHGVDNFVFMNPDARVYGFDPPRLMHLNVVLSDMRRECRRSACKRYGELTDFYMQLIRARSELALVRLINRLDMKQEERGAIVIGNGHCEDFKKLAEQYNVTLSFHSAYKPRSK